MPIDDDIEAFAKKKSLFPLLSQEEHRHVDNDNDDDDHDHDDLSTVITNQNKYLPYLNDA